MSEALQKLAFTIDLFDKVSGPAGKIQNSIQGVTDTFAKVTGGAAGIAAAGVAVSALTAPAQEFNLAIGEVRSLDVAQGSLDMLADTAISFSVKYGESAKDFVSSAYDIQSAIAGLSGEELSSFTNASNILAKGTKSDAATITDYMGTMYGIFENSATAMGKAEWVEQLTGQTATAVQMFKTTGSEMAGAFSALGAKATSAGIDQAEQMAILGKLQATMSGSEAGTKYKAFLSGIAGAQEDLGLSFTDSNGRMLGVVDILGKIQGKFGDTLDVAESDALKKAFGSDEAVAMIDQLLPKVQGLGTDIATIGNVSGMEKAMTMADSMVDPFQQWSQGVQAVRIGLGQALLPVLIPVVEGMAEGAGAMYQWTQEHPILTRYIGYAVIAVTGLTAAVATFAMVGGIASMATMGYGSATKFAGLMTGLFTKESALGKIAMAAWGIATTVASGVMTVWNVVMGAGASAMMWLNTAMMANPVLFIVGGIVLLTAGVAALIYYWDDLKAAFLDSTWGKAIMGWIDKVIGGFKSLTGAWDWVKEKMAWAGIGDAPVAGVPETVAKLGEAPVAGVPKAVAKLGEAPVAGVSKAVAKLGESPVAGVPKSIPGVGAHPVAKVPRTSPSLEAPRRTTVPAGGVTKSIATAITTNSASTQTIHIGQITTSRPITHQEVTSQLVMGS